jgi:hypothetical protein
VKDPEFYVFPVDAIRSARDPKSKGGKTNITNVENYKTFEIIGS